MRLRHPLLLILLATTGLAATSAPASAGQTTLHVVPVGHGTVRFTPAPIAEDPQPCTNNDPLVATGDRTDLKAGSCTLTYEAGTTVTLEARGGLADGQGPGTAFRQWSDDRCGSADRCTLTLGTDPTSVAALFSPQRVSWWMIGSGAVDGTPTIFPAIDCTDDFPCEGRDYELGTRVSLTAAPATPTDQPDWLAIPPGTANELSMCDEEVGRTCIVSATRPRWAAGSFDGAAPTDPLQIPPELLVRFQIRKAGSGSGTVRSQSLDCGSRCVVERTFGASETLVASADRGSRFDGWRAACGTDPTCRLAVGPVTGITAMFERTSPPGTGQPGDRAGKRRALSARVLKLNVKGRGRRRAILMRLSRNTRATVKARLVRGRRAVATRRWRLTVGSHLLRLRVPARSRPGVYRLRLTVSGNGQTKRIVRRVRLRR